ncbi:hypothetical protein SISSUDRAFT_979545 [Sistotremastrum suecicum HHB10207 ss-3]|uniref:histidine kinase n=1 Tax=Sistotremastrum suecicum HHB10207 ss-3 TaxID=1314776 RepID=A0A166HJL9_9AGAM|nr:hypothetical protein SISSUDRAFT_979545 [Sistotremastrum suecicum HHB10207 ss-3]
MPPRKSTLARPNVSFKDDILSVPGYSFEKANAWQDTGSATLLAEGVNLKEGSKVLAKISTAHSNGSLCLEREAHILELMSTSNEAIHANVTLRLLEYLTIPPESGDCVVLVLSHPGYNQLARYFPSDQINDLLIPESVACPGPAFLGDIAMPDVDEEGEPFRDDEPLPLIDLATFLELGFTHREVRSNAFHVNAHSGFVRLVHFGNRAVSLEMLGGPSSFVVRSENSDDKERQRIAEAMCCLAPEQTGGTESNSEDHRTDLYSLGVFFWMLLVGRGVLPFEGTPIEVLRAIVQTDIRPVHELRGDIPAVIARILEKLLAKHPDDRYNSAVGLKYDLLECQKRLNHVVGLSDTGPSDLIPSFQIASHDKFMEFTLPNSLFGREKEVEMIRSVIRHASTNHARSLGMSKGSIAISISSSASQTATPGPEDRSESATSRSEGSQTQGAGQDDASTPRVLTFASDSASNGRLSPSPSTTSNTPSGDHGRRASFHAKNRVLRTHTVVVCGPAGIGKSALIMAQQSRWRNHGLWGYAKFVEKSPPFSSILTCLSSVLRQLLVYPADTYVFISTLKNRLGPQLGNLHLLYDGTPELQDILKSTELPQASQESLSKTELRARFQSLFEHVLSVLAEIRLMALFLDDLHFADEASLDLISSIISAKGKMLLFVSMRHDDSTESRMKNIFSSRARTTWINLEPLGYPAISSLVSKSLHRPKEECASLARLCHRLSQGNPFSARNLLLNFRRQGHIFFDSPSNTWQYNIGAIEKSFSSLGGDIDPNNISFLVQHLAELPEAARSFISWSGLLGASFSLTEVALMIDWEDSGSEESDPETSTLRDRIASKTSMKGLHVAMMEGWIQQRARDKCAFSHDRYRQAAVSYFEGLPSEVQEKMALRIILMLSRESTVDTFRIAEYCQRCSNLLKSHPRRSEFLRYLLQAVESASSRGAHERALEFSLTAKELLAENCWETDHRTTYDLLLKIAELLSWKEDIQNSQKTLNYILANITKPEDRARVLRVRSLNSFVAKNFAGSLQDTLHALRELGVDIDSKATRRQADDLFAVVKDEVLRRGFEAILNLPKATDTRAKLAVAILNDAGTSAYWGAGEGFAEVIGLTTILHSLRFGMCPGSALGFFWTLSSSAERREMYRFSVDLGRLGLQIAERHGDKAHVIYSSMVAPYDNIHFRSVIPRLETALKLAFSAGDRIYAGFAALHQAACRIFVCEPLQELVPLTEELINDIKIWTPASPNYMLPQTLLIYLHALCGDTISKTAETAFDYEGFSEAEHVRTIYEKAGNVEMDLNWYAPFAQPWIAGLYCLGWFEAAAELGFRLYENRLCHPNHRHVRYGLFFHSLALIQTLRDHGHTMSDPEKQKYLHQVSLNQHYLRGWLSPGHINTSTWVVLVDAELSALRNDPSALKQFDKAITLAVDGDWLLEEGIALYLEGAHFIRNGVEGLGIELQRRGIGREKQWGAFGLVKRMEAGLKGPLPRPQKRHILTADVAVQAVPTSMSSMTSSEESTRGESDDEVASLSAEDLASILRWSQAIASDINLSSSLQRLTEIALEAAKADFCSVAIRTDDGDYTVSTSINAGGPCQVFENPRSVKLIPDELRRTVTMYCLTEKIRVFLSEAKQEPQFAELAATSSYHSVICLPIISNREQTFGAIFLASAKPFSRSDFTLATLLGSQASISISNAFFFQTLQQATKANIRRIAIQRDALEEARRSREEALKATKIKSNFLASMSHELRTPFSSFYGLLEILDGTELNDGQREIVQTAKQSCELLLKIIDSILDYSKLEAEALKIEVNPFPIEDVIADCMELLLPMAARKLDMSFNIEPDVPRWVTADYARIRQVLMNLLGNGIKFTSEGFVCATCSIDTSIPCGPDEVTLKFVIQDSGIGLSRTDSESLFVPFQQADNSSTRRFGGTGLGLSISRELIKLMGGNIDVESEPGVGSSFWFTIPVKVHQSDESQKDQRALDVLNARLGSQKILIASPSPATRALLSSMLGRFHLIVVNSTAEAEKALQDLATANETLDFVVADHQSESKIDELSKILAGSSAFSSCNLIHLYTPTAETLSRHPSWRNTTSGVVRLHKPPRTLKLLQQLATLKGITVDASMVRQSDVSQAIEGLATERTLYGKVLIAEDNPVAQKLLIKQLERHELSVVATSNGNEAVAEWEAHPPGYFSVALFDHHMPICDGVEACKKIRLLENRRKVSAVLPIVALSADCQPSVQRLCLSAGMNHFLTKPLKRADVIVLLSMFGESAPSSS